MLIQVSLVVIDDHIYQGAPSEDEIPVVLMIIPNSYEDAKKVRVRRRKTFTEGLFITIKGNFYKF